MLEVLAAVLAFIVTFFKELKLTIFDPTLAAALGFSPALVHYAFMGLVSVTAVGAFDAVGSILVVALMIAPPAAAYLLTDRLCAGAQPSPGRIVERAEREALLSVGKDGSLDLSEPGREQARLALQR